jgi:hypothetical protein
MNGDSRVKIERVTNESLSLYVKQMLPGPAYKEVRVVEIGDLVANPEVLIEVNAPALELACKELTVGDLNFDCEGRPPRANHARHQASPVD